MRKVPPRLHTLFAAIGARGVQRPWVVLGGVALVVAGLSVPAARLRIDPDLRALLPPNAPSVTRLDAVQRRLGAQSDLIVAIRSPSREANLRFGAALAARLRKLPELRYVIFRRDISFFRHNALLYVPLRDLLDARRELIDRLREATRKEFVVDVDSGPPAQASNKASKKGWFSRDVEEVARAALGGGEMPTEYLEADDGRIVVIKARPVEPTTDVRFATALVESVRRVIAEMDPKKYHPEMTADIRGEYLERLDEIHGIGGDVVLTAVVALAALALLIAFYFRDVRAAVVVLIPVAASTAAALGAGMLMYRAFNVVTAFIFAILLGLGIDFGIHLLARFRFERARFSLAEAMRRTLTSTGGALLAGATTTAAVFYLLQAGHFRGFSQFGAVAGTGVLLALAVTVVAMPPLVRLSGAGRPGAPIPRRPRLVVWFGLRLRRGARGLAIAVVSLSVLGAVMGYGAVGHIGFEYDFSKLGPRHREQPAESKRVDYRDAVGRKTTYAPAVALCASAEQCDALTTLARALSRVDEATLQRLYHPSADAGNAHPGGARQPAASDDDDVFDEEPPDPFEEMEAQFEGTALLPEERAALAPFDEATVRRLHHFLVAYLSAGVFVPPHQREKLAVIRDVRRRIAAKRAALPADLRRKVDRWWPYLQVDRPIGARDLPEWVRAQLTERDGRFGRFAILWNRGDKTNYRDAKELHDLFFNLRTPRGRVPLAANYFVLAEAIDTLRADGPVVLTLSLVAVLVVLFVMFRSVAAVVLTAAPLLVAMGWLALFFEVSGLKLNAFSVVAFPLLLGMGIDNGVHLFHRWREAPHLDSVLAEVGGPILMTSATTFAGFAGLLLANHVGVQTLGLTAAVGILLSLGTSVLTLPAALSLVRTGGSSPATAHPRDALDAQAVVRVEHAQGAGDDHRSRRKGHGSGNHEQDDHLV